MAATATATANGSSDWDAPLRRRRINPEGSRRPPLNPFNKLADELIEEILIRLPNPKPTCRCRAVCKLWRSLISHPSFGCRFSAHHWSRNQPAGLFLPPDDPQSVLSFLPVPDVARPRLRVFDCFRDLLLCGFGQYWGELSRSYMLCNPFTKQWIALPLAPEMAPVHNVQSAVGLVCQPRCGDLNRVQFGGEPVTIFYSEYRFRVVCLFQRSSGLLWQVFCSESGEWTQIHLDNTVKKPKVNAVSCRGKLFWVKLTLYPRLLLLVASNPFGHNTGPEPILVPIALWLAFQAGNASISVSLGAVHIIVFRVYQDSRNAALTAMRWDEHAVSWTKIYDTKLTTKTSSALWGGKYELGKCSVLDLHPDNPEIVYFKYSEDCVLSCNLRNGTGEPEFFSALLPRCYEPCWRVFQPRVSCWPTPIPRYEDLRGMYDGSYDCWVQNSGWQCSVDKTKTRFFDEDEWDALLAAVKKCGIRDWGLVKREMRSTRSRDSIRRQWKRLVEVAEGVTRSMNIPKRVLEKVRITLRDLPRNSIDDQGP